MGKEINAILDAQTILIWTYEFDNNNVKNATRTNSEDLRAIFHP